MSKWRIAGKVKQARKRAQKRADIRAGRRLSMQQMLHNTHEHNHVEETPVLTVVNDSYQLVDKENGDVLDRGTEYEMRKLRTRLGAADYSVRKVK